MLRGDAVKRSLFAAMAAALFVPCARADQSAGSSVGGERSSAPGHQTPASTIFEPEIVTPTLIPPPERIPHRRPEIPKAAKIEDVRTELDAYENAQRGIRIRAKITVDGLKGEDVSFLVFFRGEDGEKLSDPDGKDYRAENGDICCRRSVVPPYDSSLWKETTFFLPYKQLHLGLGEHALVYRIVVRDESGSKPVELAAGKFEAFPYKNTGKSATAEILRVDHNLFKGGKKGMNVRAKISVKGLRDRKASFLCYFYDVNGNNLKDSDRKFNTTAGSVCCWLDVIPKYDDSLWEDVALFMPYQQLHLTGDRNNLSMRITVQDESGTSPKALVRSNSRSFNYTHPGAWATLDDVRTEFDVVQSGKKGMRIHAYVKTNGMKGKQTEVTAYFQFSSGTKLKDFDQKYRTSDGYVCVTDRVTPSYDASEWKDFVLFIPYDQLHLAKGEHSCRYDIRVWDLSGARAVKLVESDWQNFTYTRN